MRWTYLATALCVALPAAACLAETPDLAGDHTQAMSLLGRARLFPGQNWWSRYGEPVNATALAQADALPPDKSMTGGPMPVYGDGYIFAPGSCDCPPPCIWQLWAGYYQNPLRCNPGGLLHRHGGCGACGAYAGGGGLFGHCCGHGASCSTTAACGCAAPVTCTSAVPDCGCKPVCGKCRHCHLGKWHGFAAHWNKPCSSCSLPLSCGCTTPVAPLLDSEKQAAGRIPSPLPGETALYPLPRFN